MTTILCAIAVFLTAVPGRAIELALEENRAERGSIGFVDMQRVFKLFPETTKAKESFEEAVRQAEEEINLRKAKILRLRAEIDELKVARAALPAGAAPAAAAPKAPAPAAPPKTVVPHLPGFESPLSTGTVVSTDTVNLAPGIHISSSILNAPAVSAPAAPEIHVSSAAPAPALSPAQELDEKIAQKSQELAQTQSEAKDQQAAVEVNLLDLESRKSELLLGKIYRAVQEVARREGVGVVVDKSAILYGHNAVDLTEKVLKYLKES